MTKLMFWDTSAGQVQRATVIPHNHIANRPDMFVNKFRLLNLIEQIVENLIALLRRPHTRLIRLVGSSCGSEPGSINLGWPLRTLRRKWGLQKRGWAS